MHKLFSVALLAGVLATPALAQAKEGLAGAYGGGMSGALTGSAAAHGTYRITDQIGVSATLGFYTFDPKADGVDSTGGFIIGAQGFYNFYMREKTHLGGALGVSLGTGSIGLTRITVGLRPEVFVTDWLALHSTFGFAAVIASDDSAIPSGTYMSLRGGGFASFGFTFYFGAGDSSSSSTTTEDNNDYDYDY